MIKYTHHVVVEVKDGHQHLRERTYTWESSTETDATCVSANTDVNKRVTTITANIQLPDRLVEDVWVVPTNLVVYITRHTTPAL